MIAFFVHRLLQSAIVMTAVAFVAFTLFNYVGDPVHNMVGPETTPEVREQIRIDLGLDQPFYVQFLRFLSNAAIGDFGISFRLGSQVGELIKERLPATFELSFTAAVLALAAGIPMGVYTALHRHGWLSNFFLTALLIGVSLPTFVIGIVFIWIFAVVLGILPSYGRGEVVRIGWWTTGFLTTSGLVSLILPAITLGLFQMTLIMRLVRSEMMEVLRADYITFARARGLPRRIVHFRHALKNTLVPVMTIAGLQFGSIIAFAISPRRCFSGRGWVSCSSRRSTSPTSR